MGILMGYARATISSNLRDDPYHHDHETLAAVALCGLVDAETGNTWPHSNMLLRVKYAGDASSYSRLLAEWRAHVKIKAAKRGWPIEISASKVARLALDHWLNDLCPACSGRGHLPHECSSKVLSDDPCPCCDGTSIRPVGTRAKTYGKFSNSISCAWWPDLRPVMLIDYINDMIEVLDTLTIRAGSKAFRKLAGEMPVL